MQSGARFLHHQMPICLHENPVPGLDEKRESAVRYVRMCKSLYVGDSRVKALRSLTWDKSAQFRKNGDESKRMGIEIQRNHSVCDAF